MVGTLETPLETVLGEVVLGVGLNVVVPTAAWFGPKGFASAVFGLMIWQLGATRAEHLFHLVALVIVASIVMHSSTDVLISRWFNKAGPQQGQDSAAAQTPAQRTYDAVHRNAPQSRVVSHLPQVCL